MRSALFGRHLVASIVMFLGLTVVLGFGYPLVVTGLSQLFFHKQANGSLIYQTASWSVRSCSGRSSPTAKESTAPVLPAAPLGCWSRV